MNACLIMNLLLSFCTPLSSRWRPGCETRNQPRARQPLRSWTTILMKNLTTLIWTLWNVVRKHPRARCVWLFAFSSATFRHCGCAQSGLLLVWVCLYFCLLVNFVFSGVGPRIRARRRAADTDSHAAYHFQMPIHLGDGSSRSGRGCSSRRYFFHWGCFLFVLLWWKVLVLGGGGVGWGGVRLTFIS